MTPIYASPEQLEGKPVTTSTDIYSLGLILFKILTGSLPYTLDKGANGNLLKEVTHTTPTMPSEVARRSEPTADRAVRNGTSRISASELKGDLDNIVLKALRKEPEGRYQTVEQFSADIWRFVDGMPVLARPATLSYRASKFYGRNKVSVLAAAGVLISLFLGIGIAVSQARAAREQARIAGEQRDAAQRASVRAERTSRFMQSFLDNAIPEWFGRGHGRRDVTVREAIDDAAARIDTELADEPEVRGDLHYSFGQVYASHGEDEKSLQHLRRSLELYRQALGEQHPKVARANYYVAMGIKGTGADVETVKPLLRHGIAIMRQTDPGNINLPHMLQQLAMWIIAGEKHSRNSDRLAEAESLILEARNLFVRHYGENHTATLSADGSLATLAMTRGDLERAKSISEANLIRSRQLDEGGYSHIWALFYLGKVDLALGKRTEAETLFQQATEMGLKKWGAKTSWFEKLVGEISQARAVERK